MTHKRLKNLKKDTPQLVGVFMNGVNKTPEGNPPDREYADRMYEWIDKTLSESQGTFSKIKNFWKVFFEKIMRFQLSFCSRSLSSEGCMW